MTAWPLPILRRGAETIGRRIVFPRTLPTRYGGRRFLVSSEGGLKYFRYDIEDVDPTLLEGARKAVRAGDCVWDVGANVGLFSFAASGLAGPGGQIYAIEPDTFLVELLRKSAALKTTGAASVDVLPVAISEKIGLQRFVIAKRARAANHLLGHGLSGADGVRETQTVMSVSLDWLRSRIRPPDLIKIDVEGAESDVLAGGIDTIGEFKPTIICEVSSESRPMVTRLLTDWGYALYNMEAEDCPIEIACWATLAVHRDRAPERVW